MSHAGRTGAAYKWLKSGVAETSTYSSAPFPQVVLLPPLLRQVYISMALQPTRSQLRVLFGAHRFVHDPDTVVLDANLEAEPWSHTHLSDSSLQSPVITPLQSSFHHNRVNLRQGAGFLWSLLTFVMRRLYHLARAVVLFAIFVGACMLVCATKGSSSGMCNLTWVLPKLSNYESLHFVAPSMRNLWNVTNIPSLHSLTTPWHLPSIHTIDNWHLLPGINSLLSNTLLSNASLHALNDPHATTTQVFTPADLPSSVDFIPFDANVSVDPTTSPISAFEPEKTLNISPINSSIVHEGTSPTLRLRFDAKLYATLLGKPMRTPDMVLSDDTRPRSCWPMTGPTGHITLRLHNPTKVHNVTLTHGTAFSTTAPHMVLLWAILHDSTISATESSASGTDGLVAQHRDLLSQQLSSITSGSSFLYPAGQLLYDARAESRTQTFSLYPDFLSLNVAPNALVIQVLNNWGNPECTCVYHIGVYGAE
ncbi:hypothetical protein K474DRAFT_1714237 [Panus rudis PR-1116 ss-1]|nr:hypothetical protein K474DRAFT_1714237 [Panus rudis PR-1116 ss-1]